MSAQKNTPETMDQYIAGFPKDVQKILEEIRRTIKKAAPDATETIKYKMPTFTPAMGIWSILVLSKNI